MTPLLIASLSCVIWVYLLGARGGFWRATQRDDAFQRIASEDVHWPRVVAVIPARDEGTVIGETIVSLLRQDYRGSFTLIVVDDHSSDNTATATRHAAAEEGASDRVTVLAAPSLPEGWTGKLWALHQGVSYSQGLAEPADYLLLTDADIRYAGDTLTRLVLHALCERLVLTSFMAKLSCRSFAERALIPAFIFFFQMLYPVAWVNRTDRASAAAAGGCMLVQRRSLQAAGGVGAIRGELIDDCALARLLKGQGPIWLGLTRRVCSIRSYRSIGEIRRMVVRAAYAQLRFSPWWLAGTAAAMTITFVAPPVFALCGSGVVQLLGGMGWALMALAFQPILRFYGVSPWWGVALPAIAATYLVFTFESVYQHMRGRGGEWKGRIQGRASAREVSSHDS
jgi:hopene-associated glycosyltransferase HpnB